MDSLLVDTPRTQIVTSIAGRAGRWQTVHGTFREGGLVQHLLIMTDVQHALREEERAAWKRLIRVIGHEVNNSLTPIKSMAESLQSLLSQTLTDTATRDDTLSALKVIADTKRRPESFPRAIQSTRPTASAAPPVAVSLEHTQTGRGAGVAPVRRNWSPSRPRSIRRFRSTQQAFDEPRQERR